MAPIRHSSVQITLPPPPPPPSLETTSFMALTLVGVTLLLFVLLEQFTEAFTAAVAAFATDTAQDTVFPVAHTAAAVAAAAVAEFAEVVQAALPGPGPNPADTFLNSLSDKFFMTPSIQLNKILMLIKRLRKIKINILSIKNGNNKL